MTVTFIQNGEGKLVLSPSTEIEKLLLLDLFRGPIEGVHREKLVIGDKQIVDAIVIQPTTKRESKTIE